MARTTHYAEDLTADTTVATTYEDRVTLTFTTVVDASYYLLWSAKTGMTNGSNDLSGRLQDTTNTVTLTEYNMEMHDTTDIISGFGLAKHVSLGAISTTFKIQYKSESSGATASMEDASVVAIEAHANDVWVESAGGSTEGDGNYATKATLGQLAAGDYLVIAYAEINTDSLANGVATKLDIDGVEHGAGIRYSSDITSYCPWGTMVKYTSDGSQAITIQFKISDAASTATIRNARILAIRLDTMDNNYYAEARARTTTTSTTPVAKTTLTQTTLGLSHLILACNGIDASSTTQSAEFSFSEDAVLSNEGMYEPQVLAGVLPTFLISQKTLSAAEHIWITQYDAETSNTIGAAESAIAVLQLAATPAAGTNTNTLMMMGCGT